MKSLFRKKRGIKYKYISAVLPFLILSYVVILLAVVAFSLHSRSSTLETQSETFEAAAVSSLNQFLVKMERDSASVLYDTDFQEEVKNWLAGKGKDDFWQQLSDLRADYISNYSLCLADGSLYTESGRVSSAGERAKKEVLMKTAGAQAHERKGLFCICSVLDSEGSLIAARDFYQWTGKAETNGTIFLGTLILELNESVLKEFLVTNHEGYSFALADAGGKILLNTTGIKTNILEEQAASGSFSSENHDYLVSETGLKNDTGRLMLVTDETLVYRSSDVFIGAQLLLSVISCVIISIIIIWVSSRISREFQYFIQKLNETSSLQEPVYVQMNTADEFENLSDVYNEMLQRIGELTIRIHQQEILTKDAEIQQLQAQINPHFLYNTLNCISGLIDLNRKDDSQKALVYLANLERMSLRGKPFTTIGEDLCYIREYLYIQQLRFADRLLYMIDIAEEIQQCMIPKLILQPVVENAILHGTERVKGKGVLGIFARMEENTVFIEVKDNGPGFPEDFEKKFQENTDGSTHGLYNINKRLKLYYGEKYGLHFKNGPSGGGCTVIMLPGTGEKKPEKEISD